MSIAKKAICILSVLSTFAAVAEIRNIKDKWLSSSIRANLVEVEGHEYVVFCGSHSIHSQHHVGCKACAKKESQLLAYQVDPNVQTEVRTDVSIFVSGSRICSLEAFKDFADAWQDVRRGTSSPCSLTFHIETSLGFLRSVEEKNISFEDFLQTVNPKEKDLSREDWCKAVLKNLEKIPSVVPV